MPHGRSWRVCPDGPDAPVRATRKVEPPPAQWAATQVGEGALVMIPDDRSAGCCRAWWHEDSSTLLLGGLSFVVLVFLLAMHETLGF